MEEVRIGNLIDTIGVDACLFEVTVRTRHYTTVVKFSLFELIDFCKEAHPDAHKYFKSVRKRIPGPGDQNEAMLALIMEDEYNMTYLIGDYIDKRSNIEWFHQEFGRKGRGGGGGGDPERHGHGHGSNDARRTLSALRSPARGERERGANGQRAHAVSERQGARDLSATCRLK
jgi:hypothetical protein